MNVLELFSGIGGMHYALKGILRNKVMFVYDSVKEDLKNIFFRE